MILELLQNVALLVTLAVCLQLLAQHVDRPGLTYQLAAGALFGLVTITAMAAPLYFSPGIIYDGRSIILSLAGFWGGPVTASVAAILSIGYRFHLSGAGAIVGVLVIVESAALGVLYYYLRRRSPRWEHPVWLWLFSVVVHVLMLATQLLLPGNVGWDIVMRIGPTVLLLYPLGFVVTAMVFLESDRRRSVDKMIAAQNRLLEMIAAGAELGVTLDALAREIESQTHGMLASILLLDEDKTHLRHVAAPHLPLAYTAAVDGVAIGEGVGSCGTAAWRRTRVIVKNIATDPLWTNYSALALAHGLRACWSSPIFDNSGNVLGTFALYYRTPASPTEYHLRLIDQAIHIAAVAIVRAQQDEAVRAERDFARQIVDAMGEGLVVSDADGRMNYVNQACASMVGLTPDELVGRMPAEIVIESDHEKLIEALAASRENHRSSYEVHIRHHSGQLIPVLASGVARVRNGQYLGAITVLTDLSARKSADQALRESEERYRRLVDSSPYALAIYQHGRLVFVNHAAMQLMRASEAEQLLTRDIHSFVTAEQFELAQQWFSRTRHGKTEPHSAELTVTRIDGSQVAVALIASSLTLGGQPAIQIIAQDITERKRRERELSAQARLVQVLSETTDFETLLAGILRAGIDAIDAARKGSLMIADDSETLRMRVWSGYADPRISQLRMSIHSGYAGRCFRLAQPMLFSDLHADPEIAFHGDIEEIGAIKSAIAAPLRMRGQVTGVIGLDNDERPGAFDEHDLRVLSNIAATATLVIERARLFDEINTQAQQMAQIMQVAPQGLMLLGTDGRVLTANPMGLRDLDRLANARVGDTITHLGDLPLRKLLRVPPVGPWNEVHAEGRIYEIIARPLLDEPEPTQWVVLIDDVTSSRKVQQQVQRQERLAAVGQLAAGIAHDFNNTLAVILLHAQMSASSPNLPDADRRRIAVIEEQAQHASSLVRQILDFGRQSVLQRHPVDLLALIEEQADMLMRTLPESITVSVKHDGEQYIVHADATRLRQIVINLAVNARDAMPDGGHLSFELGHLVLGAADFAPVAGMKPGDWVRLKVADTGDGIPSDILPHIFDPFFTTKEAGKGAGLGLAQVHGIVAQHEGHVTVETEPRRGSAFVIYLPADASTVAIPSSPLVEKYPTGHGKQLLLVEDNAPLRLAMTDMLGALGYVVVDAPNGRAALARLAERGDEIALILSDLVMPDMGGVAMVHALRAQGWQTPVVLMSGHPLDQEVDMLRAIGVLAWLSKPCSLEELAQTLAVAANGA